MKTKFYFVLIIIALLSCTFYNPFINDTFDYGNTRSLPDTTVPVPGNSGLLSFTNVSTTDITLNWSGASDNSTSSSNLEYLAYYSTSDNISTIVDAEANGTALGTGVFTPNITSVSLSGLTMDIWYYFNVIVRDEKGNKSCYTASLEKTVGDLANDIVFYPFTGDATDQSGNGVDITNTTTAALAPNRDSVADSAYYFDGTSEMPLLDPPELDITDGLTVSVWVNLTDSNSNQKIIGKCEPGWGFLLAVQSGKLYPEIWDSTGDNYTFQQGSIPSGTWTHLALTWKTGGSYCGYVDGVKIYEMSASTLPIGYKANLTFKIGAGSWGVLKFPVVGSIDDIRVYDREFTASEILALYNLPAD